MARPFCLPGGPERAAFELPPKCLPEPPRTPVSKRKRTVRRGFLPLLTLPETPMADHDLFFSRTGMDRDKVQQTVDQALKGSDDGELYLEYSQSESFSFADNRLKAATFDTSQGFGLRAVAGEATGYAHATEISEEAIARAAATVRAVAHGPSGAAAAGPARSNVKLYTDIDPLETAGFEK